MLLRVLTDETTTTDGLRQSLRDLDAMVRARVSKRGQPWSSVPLIRYLATETLYLEEAWSLIQRLCPAEECVPALSMLGLEMVLEEHHPKLHEVIVHRALELRDSNWAVACRQYLEPNGEDRGIGDVAAVAWEDFLGRCGQPLILLGPFTRYPRKRGKPQHFVDIQLTPGNFPDSKEIPVPGRELKGMDWFSCFELEVIRVLKKGADEEHFVSRICLVPDRWLEQPTDREAAFDRLGSFEVKQWAFAGHDDIIVMGQPRWWTELCLALALDRGGVLSRRQRNQVIEDLAPRLENRLAEQWKGEKSRARAAKRLAKVLFEYLVENFRRPLYKNALSGALKAGVKSCRPPMGQPTPVSSRNARLVRAIGVEAAEDTENPSIELVVELRRRCERVVNELDTTNSRSPAWIAERTGLDIEVVRDVLALAVEVGQARHSGHGRYCRCT